MVIRRHFQFDAAHMLSQYTGKCSNLHGHTYTGDVEISDAVKDDYMVLDFNVIKSVIDYYDHALLLSDPAIQNEAERELADWASKWKMKTVFTYGKCTAESIAKQLCVDLASHLSAVAKVKIWLHETPDSTVVATYDGHC